jgi:TonB family protein
VGNIPDATTDPSQIRVVPVVDPTAKKTSEANAGQATATGENGAADPNQANPNQASQNQTDQPSGQNPSGPAQAGDSQVKDPAPANVSVMPGNTAEGSPGPAPTTTAPAATSTQQNSAVTPPTTSTLPVVPPVQSSVAPQTVPAGQNAGIPSSLKSQIASSSTPENSGTMPAEAAMSSIEPVKLPEPVAWGLLTQNVDPVYPDAAKASGQRGSVVLQVLIGRDGTVQDAKFLQGSLVFARAAIDAVKQWRFKPYSMNGRAVSVQSTITLNFKPQA